MQSTQTFIAHGTKLLPIMKSAQSYIYSVQFFLCFFLSVQSMNLYIYIKRDGGSRILEQEEIFGFSLKYLVLLLLF